MRLVCQPATRPFVAGRGETQSCGIGHGVEGASSAVRISLQRHECFPRRDRRRVRGDAAVGANTHALPDKKCPAGGVGDGGSGKAV